MMTLEEAMAKAAKLLKLSESSNANEAALAAQMAQKILARYNIDMAALAVDGGDDAPSEPIENHVDLDYGGQRLASWKPMLAAKVAQANQCRAYLSGSNIGIVGRASDVAKVRYLYGLLSREVDKLTTYHGKGRGRSYCTSFRIGVVQAIGEKLAEAHAKVAAEMRAEHTGAALVRIDKALQRVGENARAVEAWMHANMNLGTKRSTYRSNASARADGYRAGQSVNVGGGARAALGSGSKRLS